MIQRRRYHRAIVFPDIAAFDDLADHPDLAVMIEKHPLGSAGRARRVGLLRNVVAAREE